jgi:hypothetical protein
MTSAQILEFAVVTVSLYLSGGFTRVFLASRTPELYRKITWLQLCMPFKTRCMWNIVLPWNRVLTSSMMTFQASREHALVARTLIT